VKVRVLEALVRGPKSGPVLASSLGVSRAAVHKAIGALRAEGLDIVAKPGGYTLNDPQAGYGAASLSWWCRRDVVFFDRCASTNAEAFRLASEGAGDGTLVVAGSQSAGRGRLQRAWHSPPEQSVALSLVLRPALPPASAALVCLAAAVGVAEVVTARGAPLGLKWPNDLVDHEGGKYAGLLAEVRAEVDQLHFVVLGLGVNTGPTDFPADLPRARTLHTHLGALGRAELVAELVGAIEARVVQLQRDRDGLLDAWRAASFTLGRPVRAARAEGVAIGLRHDGALLVDTGHGGVVPVLAGDVEVVACRPWCAATIRVLSSRCPSG